MTTNQVKKLKELKKYKFTWTSSISILSIAICLVCVWISIRAIKGSNVDFLKEYKELTMPNLIGLTKESVEQLDEYKDMSINFEYRYNDKYTDGKVFYQSVDAGYKITNNQTINVYVSNGKQTVQVPNIIGLGIEDAKDALNNLGIDFKVVYTITNTDDLDNKSSGKDNKESNTIGKVVADSENAVEAQTVVDVVPDVFTRIREGDKVTVYVERPYISTIRQVPSDIVGMTWSQAVSAMDKAKISNYKIFYIASDGAYDRVVSVWPRGVIGLEDTVYIKVSGGPTYAG